MHRSHDIRVKWMDFVRLIEELARIVRRSGWKPDMVVCIPKGGCLPGDILSRLFQVPIGYLPGESYAASARRRTKGNVVFPRHLATTARKMGLQILLVDDLDETGRTLNEARQWLLDTYPGIKVRTAVLWHKTRSRHRPHFAAKVVRPYRKGKWPWIIQPFERYENGEIKLGTL